MDDPIIEPDPTPEEISPAVVQVFRRNLTLQQYMALFLSKQITWRECLEHSLILLDQQRQDTLLMIEQNARPPRDQKENDANNRKYVKQLPVA